MPGAKMRALSLPVELHAVGPGHSRQELRATKNHFGISSNVISRKLDFQELAQNNTSRQKCQIRLSRRHCAVWRQEKRMAIEDDDKPRKKVTHEIGQDLSLLSVEELTERIALMTSEIERLQVAMTKKRASKEAANNFFKS
jgi:uncharacterized small protein (DUF1192 family)